jgi:Carboxypeptidase regulatory-like domain
MSFSARYLPAVLLTILSLPISLWAQTAPKQPIKAPRGSISGRVTIKEKAAAGVVVSLHRSQQLPFEVSLRATTDQDGNYRIVNVPPGSYEVTPSAPAFVPSDLKEIRAKTVLVSEDENVDNINFALVRGGVITGKVTDADGRPVIQQQVNIFRVEAVEQQQGQLRQAFPNAGGQTDDRGIYRVFGLAPGRYKVAVGRSDEMLNQSFGGPQRSTYQQVFHPDVTDQSKATVIEVGEGTEANNVDVVLGRALQTFTVSGRVVDDKGLPAPNIRLGLQRNMGQRVEFVNAFPSTNSQGDFVVEGLIPSKYGISLLPDRNSALRLETFTFDVIDQDISGLTLKLVPGASVSGVVVVEGENKAAVAKFPELQLRAYVSNPTGGSVGLGSSTASPIAPDGSFLVQGLPGGMVNFNLNGLNTPASTRGFVMLRLERDGVPVQRGVEIKDGEQLTGIRVVLGYGNGKLSGVMNLENGVLSPGARFFVRILNKSGQLPNLRSPEVDARGHFLIEDLPAGVYEIQAGVIGLTPTPKTVRREISVQDGVTTDITITIEQPQTPKP